MVQGTPCSSVRHTQGIMKYSLERERKCKDSQQHTQMKSCSRLPAGGSKPSDGTGRGHERVSGGRGRCEDWHEARRPLSLLWRCSCGPRMDEEAGSGVGAWRSPRGHGVTSVNSCQHALRQLYETRSELDVGHMAMYAPLPGSPRTEGLPREGPLLSGHLICLPSCPPLARGTHTNVQDKDHPTPPQCHK